VLQGSLPAPFFWGGILFLLSDHRTQINGGNTVFERPPIPPPAGVFIDLKNVGIIYGSLKKIPAIVLPAGKKWNDA
jgi:hypothetical protein